MRMTRTMNSEWSIVTRHWSVGKRLKKYPPCIQLGSFRIWSDTAVKKRAERYSP